jgi:Flp pilus assembly protein TadG
MRIGKATGGRRGAVMLEQALILSILVMLIIGLVVAGLGIFRYQQMVMLAREGARYASVRGAQYQAETGNPAATPADVYNQTILPMATGLDIGSLSYSVTWPNGNAPVFADPKSTPPGQLVGTTVVVTVTYNWVPEALFGGATLSSTSVMPMQY